MIPESRSGVVITLSPYEGFFAWMGGQVRIWLARSWDSAMDGYAVRAADVVGAREQAPVALTVIGEVAGGADAGGLVLAPGQAVRIMTGAMLPAGADAVVMVERTDGGTETVAVRDAVPVGRSIRPAGEDVGPGPSSYRRGPGSMPTRWPSRRPRAIRP